jgi:hypothetical protein
MGVRVLESCRMRVILRRAIDHVSIVRYRATDDLFCQSRIDGWAGLESVSAKSRGSFCTLNPAAEF